jgi:hypothetical protein
MPAAFYAISFKATSSVLAFCSFEKQSAPDQAARDQLRDALVGDKLPVGLSPNGTLKIAPTLLAVDAITGTPPADITDDPYKYQLGSAGTDPVLAGDGKDKTLKPAGANTVNGLITATATTKVVSVLLSLDAPAPNPPGAVPAWLLFDDLSPIAGVIAPGNKKLITFQLPLTLTLAAGDERDVLFLMEGVPVTYQSVTAA